MVCVVIGDFECIYDICVVSVFAGFRSKASWDGDRGELGDGLFEYRFQVPTNRIGYSVLTLNWNYFYAALCMIGAVCFNFKGQLIKKLSRRCWGMRSRNLLGFDSMAF